MCYFQKWTKRKWYVNMKTFILYYLDFWGCDDKLHSKHFIYYQNKYRKERSSFSHVHKNNNQGDIRTLSFTKAQNVLWLHCWFGDHFNCKHNHTPYSNRNLDGRQYLIVTSTPVLILIELAHILAWPLWFHSSYFVNTFLGLCLSGRYMEI